MVSVYSSTPNIMYGQHATHQAHLSCAAVLGFFYPSCQGITALDCLRRCHVPKTDITPLRYVHRPGDIGTSPLYVVSSTFTDGPPSAEDTVGLISLILWTITALLVFK